VDPIDKAKLALAAGAAYGAKEVLGPPLKEVGELFRLMVRSRLAPVVERLQNQDAAQEALFQRTIEILRSRGVDPDALRDPAEVILANALMGNLFAGGQEDIRDLFAALLATELDSGSPRAHPAYSEIIRQLSPYEARVLRGLSPKAKVGPLPSGAVNTLHEDGSSTSRILFNPPEDWEGELAVNQGDFMVALENLSRLQLVEVPEAFPGSRRYFLALTPFGASFCRSCVAEDGVGSGGTPASEDAPL